MTMTHADEALESIRFNNEVKKGLSPNKTIISGIHSLEKGKTYWALRPTYNDEDAEYRYTNPIVTKVTVKECSRFKIGDVESLYLEDDAGTVVVYQYPFLTSGIRGWEFFATQQEASALAAKRLKEYVQSEIYRLKLLKCNLIHQRFIKV